MAALMGQTLEDIVARGTDMYAFAPMEDRDRVQVHKMAAIYRLKSGSQGSGKKRFTVVTRTKHTSLPTGADKYRLAAMLDRGDGNSSVPLTGEDRRMAKKFKNAARQAFLTMQTPTPKRNGKEKISLCKVKVFCTSQNPRRVHQVQTQQKRMGGRNSELPSMPTTPWPSSLAEQSAMKKNQQHKD
jgi:hypothetical protein